MFCSRVGADDIAMVGNETNVAAKKAVPKIRTQPNPKERAGGSNKRSDSPHEKADTATAVCSKEAKKQGENGTKISAPASADRRNMDHIR